MTAKKFQIMLTFDVDAETLWTAPDPLINAEDAPGGITNDKKPSLMSMAKYGPLVAVPRIIRMLEKHGIKATFFIPGKTIERYPEMTKAVAAAGHEIGNHGYSHICPQLCYDEEEEREEYRKTNELIIKLTGKKPKSFRTPSCEYSLYTLKILEEMGIICESSLMDSDEIKMIEVNGVEAPIVSIPCSWHMDDAPLWLMSNDVWGAPMPNPRDVLQMWCDDFDFLYNETQENKDINNVFVLMMHPQLIGRPSRMKMLESFIQYTKAFPGVEFVTTSQAAQEYLDNCNKK